MRASRRRPHAFTAKTLAPEQMETMRVRTDHERPATRSDCLYCPICQDWRDGKNDALSCGHSEEEALLHSRPCVFVGCRHHTFLEVRRNGWIKFNFPDRDPDSAENACSLDIADNGPAYAHEIAAAMNLSCTGVALNEMSALRKLLRVKSLRRLR